MGGVGLDLGGVDCVGEGVGVGVGVEGFVLPDAFILEYAGFGGGTLSSGNQIMQRK